MEHHRLPRRSASHGTLRSSYTSHGRPLHKPLRAVNENSVLLPSPGALESMLKTTTETGDIGIFSIKPVSSSSNLGGLSPRRNGALGDRGQFHPPLRRPTDDRRRMPSYRDTTSEILSMYGSTSQSSFTSTLSPSMDDLGQRSYSMTTCGSRHLSHYKSSTTLSQHSGGNLQRPRSPFPYPTRLKRMGARPSSPAVTENGLIDYSRMVEIDRISLRTGHGTLKPSYPHPPRGPPPLGLRADANQSTPSLRGPGPPGMRHHARGPPSMRTTSAASMASLNVPSRERLDSTSSRTSSLTSVINMYHRMPPALKSNHPSPAAPPPRYYDYTEDFESKQSRSTTPVQPIAPVPTRAPSVQRPLVLREGSEEQLAAALGVEADSAFFDDDSDHTDSETEHEQGNVGRVSDQQQADSEETQEVVIALDNADQVRTQTRSSDIDLLPSQIGRESMDTFNPSLDIESREVAAYSYPNYRATASSKTMTTSPGRQVQLQDLGTPSIRSEQGVILTDDVEQGDDLGEGTANTDAIRGLSETPPISLESPTKQRSRSEPAKDMLKKSSEVQRSPASANRRTVSTGPVNSNFINSNADTHPTSRFDLLEDADRLELGAIVEKPEFQSPPVAPKTHQRLDIRETPTKDNQDSPEANASGSSMFRRHKRNPAALRIIPQKLPSEDDDGFPQLTPSCSVTPLISPKPISPARELKVKNSIPQLMKALPPLPGEPGYIPSLTPSPAGDDDDFDEVLAPFRFSPSGTLMTLKASKATQLRTKSARHSRVPSLQLQKKLPKIRLKPKEAGQVAMNPRDSRPWNSDNNYPWTTTGTEVQLPDVGGDDKSLVSTKRRLKLRTSRSVCGGTPPAETVRRNPDVRGSDLLADLASDHPKDLFSFSNGLSSAFRQVSRKLSHHTHDGRQISTEKPASAPEASETQQKKLLVEGSATKPEKTHAGYRGKVDERNLKLQKVTALRQRGLKKSLSNLKWLMEKSPQVPSQTPTSETQIVHGKVTAGLDSIFGTDDVFFDSKNFAVGEGLSPPAPQRAHFRRRVRDKVSKWVKHTKAAVKSIGKRSRGL